MYQSHHMQDHGVNTNNKGSALDSNISPYFIWLSMNIWTWDKNIDTIFSTEVVLASTFLILVILMFLAWVSGVWQILISKSENKIQFHLIFFELHCMDNTKHVFINSKWKLIVDKQFSLDLLCIDAKKLFPDPGMILRQVLGVFKNSNSAWAMWICISGGSPSSQQSVL